MHLAYLDPHPVPDDGPEALQILYTVDALGGCGVDVTLITPRPRTGRDARDILGRELSPRVQFEYVPDLRKRWWLPSASSRPFYWMASRRLGALGIDAVLTRNLKMAEHLLRRGSASPLFFETHEWFAQSYRDEHPQPNRRERRKLAALAAREAFVYRRARGLVALTALLADDIREAYALDTPTTVAPDGVDLEAARAARREHPPHDRPLLLYLGSLHPWKGVPTLVEALVHLRRPARLKVVGGNNERIAELRALAQRLGVADRVLLSGPCPPAERFAVIQEADVCLLPLSTTSIGSRYTSPLKLFEYLAMGKPVVVSDLPSMRAVVTDGETALLARAGDPSAFAGAIERILADRALAERLGANGAILAERFTWTARARAISMFVASRIASEDAPHG